MLFFALCIHSKLMAHTSVVNIQDKLHHNFRVSLTDYKNQNGDLEVRIEAYGIPRFASKINPTMGFGRDTGGNGKIDTWFLLTKNGIDSLQQEGQDFLGRDILSSVHTYNQIQFHNQLLSLGYRDLADKMDRFSKKTLWGYAFADLGLWITGGVVINWDAKILARLGAVISENTFVVAIKDSFFSFFEKQKDSLDNRLKMVNESTRLNKEKSS